MKAWEWRGLDLSERFERQFVPEPTSGCWLWTGALNTQGYGMIGVGKKQPLAHRVSWQLFKGQIPDRLCVLHRCDNPVCVNPEHLFLGTKKDNAVDMFVKGRAPDRRGSKHHNSKLTDADIVRIRTSKLSGAEMARELGVRSATVSGIRLGKSWKHVATP